MNNNFKYLIKQIDPVAYIGNWGRVQWAENIYPQLNDNMYGEHHLEEMAKLVLDECINKLIDMHYEINDAHNFYQHAAERLKVHFNIK